MKFCFGIPSYLPDEQTARSLRIERLDRLFKNIKDLFGISNIIIIAQNWKDYTPKEMHNYKIFKYDKLGILKARKILREKFLTSNFDYLIMCDDDCIIEASSEGVTEYINKMANNPNGFAYREENEESLPSQLNMFAISKYLYSKEEMVDINPQKSEGFEDDIFTNLLRYKYPELQWHFDSIYCTHFKNPNEETPSTWSKEVKYDWCKLKQNTRLIINEFKNGNFDLKNIKKNLVKKSKINFPIDYIFPYVDNNDEVWRKQYKRYCLEHNKIYELYDMENARFTDLGTLRHLLNCIENNMPWIRKIHLIVSNIEQVPSWIDKNKINIVLHKNFIPLDYLPTFNSTTIEMFLHNIPDLAEHFIYGNDDIYPIGKLEPSDFFTIDGKIRANFEEEKIKQSSAQFRQVCYNNYRDIAKITTNISVGDIFLRPLHTITPMIKSHCKEVIDKLNKDIFRYIRPFRTAKQHNQYLYPLYEHFTNNCEYSNLNFVYVSFKDSIETIVNTIKNENIDIACVNDCSSNNRPFILLHKKDIYTAFSERLDKNKLLN